jgi:Pyruvate/2-oxoacid:ferredoxin oxidoreductase delta subunit
MHVCHKDGNPVNNRLGNLRYDTPAGNSQDAMKHGTHVGVRTAARTHCPQGHEFTPDNIYMRPSKSGKLYRKCKKCAIKRTLVSRAKRRAREKDFCTNGHQFTPENTTWRISRNGKKYRKCKRCWADTIARYRARKKAGLV